MSIVLAIETSQRLGGVALRAEDGTIHTEMLAPQKRHDDDLLPAIDRLFARLKLSREDLSTVGISIGPGGFTGLRIAVATAKMFAEALGVKIIAAPSALVAAENYLGHGPIIVALASKADTCWCTRLHRVDQIWSIAAEPRLSDSHQLDLHGIEALLGDEHLPAGIAEICKKKGLNVVHPVFEPSGCLAVTERMLRAGLIADPLSVHPLYPRQPEAATLWERAKGTGKRARK